MCGGGSTVIRDPSDELSKLILASIGVSISEINLRRLIKHKWPELKRLAHAIHDEETSEIKKAAKNIAALSEDGVLNVISGAGMASSELREDFKRIVKEFE